MTKQDVADRLAGQLELSNAEASRVVNTILDELTQAMVDGEDVNFAGFGKFTSQRRRAREGVNPQDPTKKIRIRAANVPKFKPGARLREAVAQLQPPAAAAGAGGGSSARAGDGAGSGTGSAAGSSAEPGEWVPLAERR